MALVERGGWFAADRFVAWLRRSSTPACKDGPRHFSGLTLAQFLRPHGRRALARRIGYQRRAMLVLNHHTAPGCPVVWAVRMSMSIPLVWNEVVWQSDWGQYLGRDVTGHAIVDGGLLSNFPIELFISDEPT